MGRRLLGLPYLPCRFATEGLRSSAERLSEFPTYLATVSVWPFDVSGFLDPGEGSARCLLP